jgi:tripartite-type tricarboxylate transporter receptor subunit TctC
MRRRTLLALPSLVVPASFLTGAHANAQAPYPSKPIHIVVSVSAALQERIISLGAEPAASTPDQLAKILANDLERLQPIVERTGASLD